MMTTKTARLGGRRNAVMDRVGELLQPQDDEAGTIELVSLSRIDLSPSNPRKLGLSRTNPREISETNPNAATLREELLKLEELASSIEAVSLIQPVGVYRHGDRYLLAWGERRVFAYELLGRTAIPAKILPGRPSSLLAMQMVENLHRRDLSLREHVDGFSRLLEEAAAAGTPTEGPDAFQKLVGFSQATSYRYWNVVHAPDDVRAAIAEGVIRYVSDVLRVAAITSPKERAEAIEALRTGKPLDAAVPVKVTPVARPRKSGRPVSSVSIGKVGSPKVLRYVAEHLCSAQEFEIYKSVDWNDLKVGADILHQILKKLEQRLVPKEKKA